MAEIVKRKNRAIEPKDRGKRNETFKNNVTIKNTSWRLRFANNNNNNNNNSNHLHNKSIFDHHRYSCYFVILLIIIVVNLKSISAEDGQISTTIQNASNATIRRPRRFLSFDQPKLIDRTRNSLPMLYIGEVSLGTFPRCERWLDPIRARCQRRYEAELRVTIAHRAQKYFAEAAAAAAAAAKNKNNKNNNNHNKKSSLSNEDMMEFYEIDPHHPHPHHHHRNQRNERYLAQSIAYMAGKGNDASTTTTTTMPAEPTIKPFTYSRNAEYIKQASCCGMWRARRCVIDAIETNYRDYIDDRNGDDDDDHHHICPRDLVERFRSLPNDPVTRAEVLDYCSEYSEGSYICSGTTAWTIMRQNQWRRHSQMTILSISLLIIIGLYNRAIWFITEI